MAYVSILGAAILAITLAGWDTAAAQQQGRQVQQGRQQQQQTMQPTGRGRKSHMRVDELFKDPLPKLGTPTNRVGAGTR